MRPLRKSGVLAECFEVLKPQVCSSLKNGWWKCGFNLLRAYQMDVASNANGQSAIAPHPSASLKALEVHVLREQKWQHRSITHVNSNTHERLFKVWWSWWFMLVSLTRFEIFQVVTRKTVHSGNFRVSKGIYSSWAVLGSYSSIHFLASSSTVDNICNPNQRPATCHLLRPPGQHGCFGLESGTNWYYRCTQNSSKAHSMQNMQTQCNYTQVCKTWAKLSFSAKLFIKTKNHMEKIFQDASSLVHSLESICDLQRLHGLLVFCMVTESDDLESLFSSDTEVGLPWVTYEKLVKGFGRVHIVTLPTLLCNPTRNINGWSFFF